jgi:hypothetical protein
MKRIILSSVWAAAMLITVSCGQTNSTEQNAAVAENEVQAVQEINIEDGLDAKVEEVVVSQDVVEPGTKPKKSTNVKPTPPTPEKSKSAESPKPSSEPAKEVIEIPRPADEETKPKGNTKTRVPALPTKTDEVGKEPAKTASAPSHSAWNSLLSANVNTTGAVNYAAIKRSETALDGYLKLLADNPVQNSWSRNEQMAYWINLYNASTVKLIVENYPTKSIQNLEGGKPWDKKWIKSGSKTYTLNEIENSVLRPQFKDARIHFAVNCAAQSCPRLMNKAFTSDNLESLLEQNAKWFINSKFNNITANKIQVSKIFKWYADDFGNVIDYLNKYSTIQISDDAKVDYLEYDWKLNGK